MPRKRVAEVLSKSSVQAEPARGPRTAVGGAIHQQLLSRRQVAVYLGCSVKFVIQLVKSGQLAETDLGPYLKRYKLADVEKLVESRRRAPFAQEAA